LFGLRAVVEPEAACCDPGDDHAGGKRRNSAVKKKANSKVNAAGNYTKPAMRESLFKSIKSRAVQGTAAGQWSGRKAQLLAKSYKAKGGGYKD